MGHWENETVKDAERPEPPKSMTPEGKEIPLLQITLDESSSVPKVFYKGEEIKFKKEVIFHWETDTDVHGGTTIEIEHFVKGAKTPECNRIVNKFKSHVCDKRK